MQTRASSTTPQAEYSDASPWPKRLRRDEASTYLATVHGIKLARQTLARMAYQGTGPAYSLLNRIPYYETDALDRFAEERLTPPAASTAAHKGRGQAGARRRVAA